jgi:hypothetical protein
MNRLWAFDVDCPRCGGQLDYVTGSRHRETVNLESKAVAACAPCRDTYILVLTLRSETNRRTLDADFNRHLKRVG